MKRVLLAYFSRRGENYYGGRTDLAPSNTEVLAEEIASRIVYDTHRVHAAAPYPHDYDANVQRNVRDQDTDARPAIDAEGEAWLRRIGPPVTAPAGQSQAARMRERTAGPRPTQWPGPTAGTNHRRRGRRHRSCTGEITRALVPRGLCRPAAPTPTARCG